MDGSAPPSASAYPTGAPPLGRRRRRGSVVWPLLLISAGVLFLLQNYGLVPWDVWGQLWRLWPLVMILVGVELFLGGRLGGALLGAFVVMLLIGGVAVLTIATRAPWSDAAAGAREVQSYTHPLEGAGQGDVRVEFGAGQLGIGALEPGTGTLATGTYDGPTGWRPEQRTSVGRNGVAEVRYSQRGARGFNPLPFLGVHDDRSHLQIRLSPDVPISLRVTTGASEGRIDLSKLKVTQLDVETGASKTWVRMPEAAGLTTARIQAGAASLEVELPADVGAIVHYEGGLSNVEVVGQRLSGTGEGTYRSPNYDTAANKIDLRIEAGATSVTVR